jgi:hypothetical protein
MDRALKTLWLGGTEPSLVLFLLQRKNTRIGEKTD